MSITWPISSFALYSSDLFSLRRIETRVEFLRDKKESGVLKNEDLVRSVSSIFTFFVFIEEKEESVKDEERIEKSEQNDSSKEK